MFSYCPDLEEARARELVLRVGTKHVDELLANHPAEASAFAVRHFGICKDKDAQLFLPQKGGRQQQQQEEERRRRKGKDGGGAKAAKRNEQQHQRMRPHEKKGGGGKCEKSRAQRRADKTRKMWKMRRRREAVEG